MRVLLRVLAPLLGLALAAAGALLAVEVAVAWLRPTDGSPTGSGLGTDGSPAGSGVGTGESPAGLLVPWPAWRTAAENTAWATVTVLVVAIAVAVIGLLLLVIGLLARRNEIALAGPTPEITVTTSPRVLARLIGRRVRAADEVEQATVTASARKVSVRAQGRDESGPELRDSVSARVGGLLDELPLVRRPRVGVAVAERKGR